MITLKYLAVLLMHVIDVAVSVDLRFPVEWNGDKYTDQPCQVLGRIPPFIDGYFLSQLSASYGDQSHGAGHKLTHMIDAIGGLASFQIKNGQATFSGSYYPSQPYRIWEYYGRDLNRSQVVWNSWSDYNRTAASLWQSMRLPDGVVPWHPNRAFWLSGTSVLAIGHSPLWLGLRVDLPKHQFSDFEFNKDELGLLYAEGSLHPLLMSVNSVHDPNGLLWATCSAVDMVQHRSFLLIFTIDERGNRVIRGLHQLGKWQPDLCADDHTYHGEKSSLASYVHSIIATDQFLLVPLSSLAVNPCKLKSPPSIEVLPGIDKGGVWGLDFYNDLPIRFLVFDMEMQEFLTDQPLQSEGPAFLTNIINTHQRRLGLFSVDVITYDTAADYFHRLHVDQLQQHTPIGGTPTRYDLQLLLNRRTRAVSRKELFGRNFGSVEYPTINSMDIGKPYEWSYLMRRSMVAESILTKASVTNERDEVSSVMDWYKELPMDYSSGPDMVFVANAEFIPQPNSQSSDTGVLIVRAMDMVMQRGQLIFINATDMTEMARVIAPTSLPLGLSNRFFTSEQLGMGVQPMQPVATRPPVLPYTMGTASRSTVSRMTQPWTWTPTPRTTTSSWTTTRNYNFWRTSTYRTRLPSASESRSALCNWFPRLFNDVDAMCPPEER